eukprot:6009893-Amphidinium_carterae.1
MPSLSWYRMPNWTHDCCHGCRPSGRQTDEKQSAPYECRSRTNIRMKCARSCHRHVHASSLATPENEFDLQRKVHCRDFRS